MPQPPEVVGATDEIIALIEASSRRILDEQAKIATAPNRAARRTRLRELERAVNAEMDRVMRASSGFMQQSLPGIYARGGTDTQLITEWTWSQVHRQALAEIVDDGYEKVLEATEYVRGDVKRWVRESSRALTASAVIEGKTPQQIALELRRAAPLAFAADGTPLPLTAIRYANGARMPLAPYAAMLMRTQTALAYNVGTLETVKAAGVTYVEVLDGSECGFESHDDTRKANGLILRADEAGRFPIAHPQCRRAFAPRPELTTTQEATQAQRTPTASVVDPRSTTDQALFERGLTRPPRAARKPRPPRTGEAGEDFRSRPLRARRNAEEINADNTLDTEAAYSTDGVYRPDRAALHDDIVQAFTDEIPASDRPTFYMTGGGPASGKSTMVDANPARFPSAAESVHIDPDGVKKYLPEYNRLVADGDSRAAAFAHEESSYLSKRVIAESFDRDQDILFDSVGDSGIEKLSAKLDQAHAAGHRVVANYASNDLDLAIRLSEARAKKTGRRVPLDYLVDAHADVTDTFIDAVRLGKFDEAYLWDTNIQNVPRLIGAFDGDTFEIIDLELFEDFVAKGSRSLDEVLRLLDL
jgi:predicted ABC-type ATPase